MLEYGHFSENLNIFTGFLMILRNSELFTELEIDTIF